MIQITVTGKRTGNKALLYEFPGRKGRRAFVPTYHAVARNLTTQEQVTFSVARTSSLSVFGTLEDAYGENGECPPSKEGVPYRGTVRSDGSLGFRIQLVEEGYEMFEGVMGQGATIRRHVQIHFGAAASHGCILVAGRRRLYRSRFERPLRALRIDTDLIEVIVDTKDPCT